MVDRIADGTRGEQRLRLEAERTRDELQETLAELEHRLQPREFAHAVQASMRRRPGVVVGVGLALAGVVAGIVLVTVRRG